MGSDNVKIGAYGPWELVDKACSKMLDGGDPNNTTYTMYVHPRSESGGLGLQVAYARLQNRSGATSAMGMGVRIPKVLWKAGQWTDSTTTFTDDTTDFQDAGTADAALETTTNNDGLLVSSPLQFNALAIAVTTASAGTPTRQIEYSTGTSSWTVLTNPIAFDGVDTNYTGSGAENIVVWGIPCDWTVMTSGHGTGVTVGHYGLRIRSTVAPSTAGVAATMSVHRIYFPLEGITDNGLYEIPLGSEYARFEQSGDALVSFFSVANPQNLATALVRARG